MWYKLVLTSALEYKNKETVHPSCHNRVQYPLWVNTAPAKLKVHRQELCNQSEKDIMSTQ
jgi:hypothetical protein